MNSSLLKGSPATPAFHNPSRDCRRKEIDSCILNYESDIQLLQYQNFCSPRLFIGNIDDSCPFFSFKSKHVSINSRMNQSMPSCSRKYSLSARIRRYLLYRSSVSTTGLTGSLCPLFKDLCVSFK